MLYASMIEQLKKKKKLANSYNREFKIQDKRRHIHRKAFERFPDSSWTD